MENQNVIANLTQHQNITDALLNTMGECMAVQQALLHIPPYDGKNLPLKTFLQDVENGLAICPEGIHNAFFKGVIAKLRDTARDAVSGHEINSIDDLKDALKEYFAPKKTYTHYCAEIQGIRMRKGETVIEYYARIKRIMQSAKASLKDKFTPAQVPHMELMLEGIALESFKRGLSDDLLYAVSVQEPETLDAAVKIARRIERDMSSYHDRRSTLNVAEASTPSTSYTPRQVMFRDDRRRSPSPWRDTSSSPWRNFSPQRELARQEDYKPPQRTTNFDRTSRSREGSPMREPRAQQQDYWRPTDNAYRSRSPYRHMPPMPYPYMPPVPYPYHYVPQPFYQPPPQMYATNPQAYAATTQMNANRQEKTQETLNSQGPRRTDAATSEQPHVRPPTVKFLSAEDMINSCPEEELPHP